LLFIFASRFEEAVIIKIKTLKIILGYIKILNCYNIMSERVILIQEIILVLRYNNNLMN